MFVEGNTVEITLEAYLEEHKSEISVYKNTVIQVQTSEPGKLGGCFEVVIADTLNSH